MAEVIARDADRLPWLADEKVLPKATASWWRLPFMITAVVAIAMGIVWLGVARQFADRTPDRPQAEVTAALPEPTPPVAQSPAIVAMPQVDPAPVPAPPVIRMQEEVRPSIVPAPSPRRVATRPSAKPAAKALAKAAPRTPRYSNPWESAGASGRMVRVGTYASLRQGKIAWSRLARAYPGMKTLPAVVTDLPSLRNGRVYYRLQIGTTSQAHSEVLCQRMRSIGQSCVVVDVAGARKGSGDDGQPAAV